MNKIKYPFAALLVWVVIHPQTSHALSEDVILRQAALPITRYDLPKTIDQLFSLADTNHNNIYDPQEQMADTLKVIEQNSQQGQRAMPACQSLGLLGQTADMRGMITIDGFSPLLKESILFLANQSFDRLDKNRDNQLTAQEVNEFQANSDAVSANMNKQCLALQESVKSGDLPDPKIMEAIITSLVELNKQYATK